MRQVMQQACRMLKPGGVLLSISLNNDEVWNRFCSNKDLIPSEPTSILVRTIDAGQPKPTKANIYIRHLKRRA